MRFFCTLALVWPFFLPGWRFWAGDVDAGLFVKLKGTELDWNSGEGGAVAPASWSNAGKGGIKVTEDGPNATSDTSVEFEAFSGARSLAPGASVTFNFSLLATPVKGDYQHTDEGKREHYVESRHYHVPYGEWDPINTTEAEGLGANVVILHQSNRLNPYINYPFQPTIITALKEYVLPPPPSGLSANRFLGASCSQSLAVFTVFRQTTDPTRGWPRVCITPYLGGLPRCSRQPLLQPVCSAYPFHKSTSSSSFSPFFWGHLSGTLMDLPKSE